MVAVGYLTIAFAEHVSAEAARESVDEIAREAISYPAITGVKCDIGELTSEQEIEFEGAELS